MSEARLPVSSMALRRLLEDLSNHPEMVLALMEHIPSGIAFHDELGATVVANRTMEAILGLRPTAIEDYRMRTHDGLEVPVDDVPVAKALRGEIVRKSELVVERPDETTRRVSASALPLRNAEGEVSGGVMMLVEVSEARAADAIEKAVLGVVAHDLRNPLAAVRLSAQVLARPGQVPEERRHEAAARILASAQRMDALLGAVLEYARSRGGAAVRLARQRVDLFELAERVVAEQEAALPGAACSVSAQGDVVGLWDGPRLEQVVANLVSNAVRHGRPGTRVEVWLDGTRPASVDLGVRNQGPPIPPERLAHLFEPFRNGSSSAREGLGLGLFIVKNLVEAHGGTLAVRSDDAGTACVVTLPRAEG